MYYKRNEPFRYTFGKPLEAVLETISKEEDTPTSTGKWEVLLLDISPNGLKIVSSTNITLPEDSQIRSAFKLNETQFELAGKVSWKKARGLHFEYGIVENNSDFIKNLLISELKAYTKKISQKN